MTLHMDRRDALKLGTKIAGGTAALALLSGCFSDAESEANLALPGPLPEKTVGDPNAPIKMIEYASMTCPHCASFHNRTYPALKEKYIETGKVEFAFREFPLDPAGATVAAIARCAPDDRFFDVVNVYFQSQSRWRSSNPLPGIIEIAKQVGFTQQTVNACLTNQELIAGINAIRTHGAEVLKVDATPTFFVNGKKIVGSITLEALEQEFAQYLS